MADSDSTNAACSSRDIPGELETLQNALKVLNGISRDIACDYSANDDREATMAMVEKIIVMANSIDAKLNDFDELVHEAYKVQFALRGEVVS